MSLEQISVACDEAFIHFQKLRPIDWLPDYEEAGARNRGGGFHDNYGSYSGPSRPMCRDPMTMKKHTSEILSDALLRLGCAGWSCRASSHSDLTLYSLTKTYCGSTVSDGGAFHALFIREFWVAAWALDYKSIDEQAPCWKGNDYDRNDPFTARPYFASSLTRGQGPSEVKQFPDQETFELDDDPLIRIGLLLHAIMTSDDGEGFGSITQGCGKDVVRSALGNPTCRMSKGATSHEATDILRSFSDEDQSVLCTMILRYEVNQTVRMERKWVWGRQVKETSHTMDFFSLLIQKRSYHLAHQLLLSNVTLLQNLNFGPEYSVTKQWRGHHWSTDKDSDMNLLHLVAANPPREHYSEEFEILQKILHLIENLHRREILISLIHSNTTTQERTGVSGKGYSSGSVASYLSPVAYALLHEQGRTSLTTLTLFGKFTDVFGLVELPKTPGGEISRQWARLPEFDERSIVNLCSRDGNLYLAPQFALRYVVRWHTLLGPGDPTGPTAGQNRVLPIDTVK